jgi:hypothetical protein
MEKTFDEMMAELKVDEPYGGRKLTFTQKCGIFAALYGGARNAVIARAFGLTPQTVSKLAGCLENDPDPYRYEYQPGQNQDLDTPVRVMRDHNRNRRVRRLLHYPDVAREFEALGRDEFTRRYYTPRIHEQITNAKHDLRIEFYAKRKQK